MVVFKFETLSAQETQDVASKLASKLKGGEAIGLSGDLGAGKTTFVKGLAKALGIKATVLSPTFLLLKAYSLKRHRIKQLVHVDTYRLDHVRDLREIGLFDFIGHKDSIVLVEWAEKIKKHLPKNTVWVKIKIAGGDRRQITISPWRP